MREIQLEGREGQKPDLDRNQKGRRERLECDHNHSYSLDGVQCYEKQKKKKTLRMKW